MPRPTPFHARTSELCTSLAWKDWAGFHAVRAYGDYPAREYHALRQAAGAIDVSPLFKYDVEGPDAAAFLAHVLARDIRRLRENRVVYCCWTDDRGKLLDDGTVARLPGGRYRLTSTEPNLAWLRRNAPGFDVSVRDTTDSIAALSVQGPTSRAVVEDVAGARAAGLRFFGLAEAAIGPILAVVTRTGYTGDLGYEIWVPAADAVALLDAVLEAGAPHGLIPAGLDAMDVTRVEAGFLLNGVDYWRASRCLIESRKSTPFEAGLGWTVHLDRDPFVGQTALAAEKERGAGRHFVGLEVDWDRTEDLFRRLGLPPEIRAHAWRDPVPVWAPGEAQVGYATSGAWSPVLKRNLALATVNAPHGEVGEELEIEVTVEYVRHRVRATVRPRPFFDPERKRAVFGRAAAGAAS